MSRRHGARPRVRRNASLALAAGLGLAGLAMLFVQSSAHADVGPITLGTSNLGTISVAYGDSVVFTAESKDTHVLGYAGMAISGVGSLPAGQTATYGPLTAPGLHAISWKAY